MKFKLTERHVQAIWYDAAYRPKKLYTRRGSEVRVIDPGEWNLEAGPDFRHAVLEIGKEHRRIVGDVEVHLQPRDWDAHGHGGDVAYQNVIAHVTWGCGPTPDSLPPQAVSIWLGRFMCARTDFSAEQIDLSAYPYAIRDDLNRPCEESVGRKRDVSERVLLEAGRTRLRAKAARFQALLAHRTDRRQVFYEEVMSAFGYKRNAEQFRHVAVRVPLEELPREEEVARSALLAAGSFEEWNRQNCRPNNSPERRLAGAAEALTQTPLLNFSEAGDFSPTACRSMVREMRGVGKGRAAAILANVIVPFALAEGRLGEVPTWLPPEDLSSPLRLMGFRLFGRDHAPRIRYLHNDVLAHGLLHLYRTYCQPTHPFCPACHFSRVPG